MAPAQILKSFSGPAVPGSDRTGRDAALLAAGVVLLQSLTWLPLLLRGISPVAFAAESVAYRYFHSFRLVRRDPSVIWEAQGQTLGVVHELFQKLLDWLGIASLRARMDFFSYGTLALNSLLFGIAIFGVARALPAGWRPRLLLAGASLFGVYGCWWGVFSGRLPDYYTCEVTATTACLGLFLVGLHRPEADPTVARVLFLGALGGALLGLKVTLLPTALLPVWPYLLRGHLPWSRLVAWAGLWLATVLATAGIVLSAYYLFDFAHLTRAFHAWRSFVSAPGAEPGFLWSLLHPFAPGANPWADHRYLPVVATLWVLAVAAAGTALWTDSVRRRERAVFVLYVLVCSALHVWAVLKRPAETTLFESALFLVVAAAALLATLPARAAFQRATALALIVIAGWTAVSGLTHLPSTRTIAAMQETSRNAWELHAWLNAQARPITILMPDNRYVSGSVEETLLKGFSDVPTWNITIGRAALEAVAPGRTFVSQADTLSPGSLFMWTDVPDLPAFVDLGQKPLVILGQPVTEVRSWSMQADKFWPRTVHVAVLGNPPRD